jgi:hypothetical protein
MGLSKDEIREMIRDEAVKANEVLGGELGEIMQAIKELKQRIESKDGFRARSEARKRGFKSS